MQDNKKVQLSIVIVNWNTKDYLYECLKSIIDNTFDITYTVFVVDNASTDGSIEMVETNFPEVILIKNSENLGFAKANNIALGRINAEFVLLLNSDTKVLSNCFNTAVSFLAKNPTIGALSPQILNSDGTIQHPCYIGYPSILSEMSTFPILGKFLKNYNQFGKNIPADETNHEIVHATGACLFIRKKALDEVGLLDEALVFSFEDADWCLRAKNKKWSIIYFPLSKVIHYGSATLKKFHGNKINPTILISKHRFFCKYHSKIYVELLIFLIIVSSVFKMAFVYSKILVSGNFSKNNDQRLVYYQVYRWNLSIWGMTLRKKVNAEQKQHVASLEK